MAENIFAIIKEKALNDPSQIALQAPGRADLNYHDLARQIDRLRQELESLGFCANDRVAVVLSNGPEMTVVCLFLLSFFSVAPLNPKYKYQEFDFYLSDLRPKGLIILAGDDSPARSVAKEKGIKIFNLAIDLKSPAGVCSLSGERTIKSRGDEIRPVDDIALVLHTSGTTSRPKIVPLTRKNIFVSAQNTIKTLKLNKKDKCLNVMPLFHIHGFIVTMATLITGGTIICPSSFQSESFFAWFKKYKPSWYTASPTIHQAVLTLARANKKALAAHQLRFIRSSSAPLSPEIINELESVFQAPVAESYGMTEAALQITSNQLPPGKKKPGSAGIADGPELKVVNEKGKVVKAGEVGEIIIKGENIISAYENNKEANQTAFADGWFRTGDLGYLDEDAFLFITGRSKEMINKGGENIAPREIDELIMRHKDVEQAVAFAVPHSSLGEEVGVAIVLKKRAKLTKEGVQKFVSKNLADFKVPQSIFFVTDIPKGPTGKLQRIGLYEKLEPTLNKAPQLAKNDLEKRILKIWQEVLKIKKINVDDNFFEIGGDSLRINELIAKTKKQGLQISVDDFLNSPTISGLIKIINK